MDVSFRKVISVGDRPSRICKRCHALAEPGTALCAKHRNADALADAQRKAANPLWKLYNCKMWKVITRVAVLMYCNGQCQWIPEGESRCMRLAAHIHHVVPAARWVADGHDFYDTDNLAAVCFEHHQQLTNAEKQGTTVPGSFAPPDNKWSPPV